MVRGQWANLGFLMTTESQDLGLTSHPKELTSSSSLLFSESRETQLHGLLARH